jgi:hypothetical protein
VCILRSSLVPIPGAVIYENPFRVLKIPFLKENRQRSESNMGDDGIELVVCDILKNVYIFKYILQVKKNLFVFFFCVISRQNLHLIYLIVLMLNNIVYLLLYFRVLKASLFKIR